MNTLKDLFTASFVEAVSLRITKFDLFDLRTKVDFSFFSPAGIVVLLLLIWAMASVFHAGPMHGCEVDKVLTSCTGFWPVLVALLSVSVISSVAVRFVSQHLSVATFADNAIVLFLAGAFVLFLLRHFGLYSALTDLLGSAEIVGAAYTDAVAAVVSTIVAVIALSLYSLRRRLRHTLGILKLMDARDALVIAVYALSCATLIYFIFGYA